MTVARTAHEALKRFTHGYEGLNLIIVDLEPKLHGVTLFNALDNCQDSHNRAPVVALTNCEETYMKPLAMGRGAAGCLGKPVNAARFRKLLEEFTPSKPETKI